MKFWQQEQGIKLDILTSLARSQKALTSMIEDVAEMKPILTSEQELLRELVVMGRYQRLLVEKILMIRSRNVVHGRPGEHWIADSCKIQPSHRS